ncbi:hypothetical protein EPA93_13290 [Ktedonosporobacter rubrisoli]|uniref:Uncharacterized protein n=1 Tax=Ktedonosporobacter rubrisoli TaxID=2509675 RepID=A0A4P6JNQ5_KTERU|nr:hypothetical protein [Ktedonosporobacter rubrisoli]QBD76924.1 hypothetical protein EPA93_13290 [Ktedonosporobacter rubrisoli]
MHAEFRYTNNAEREHDPLAPQTLGCSVSAILAAPIVLLIKWLWPSAIPFQLFQFWTFHGPFNQLLFDLLPLIVGVVIFHLLSIPFYKQWFADFDPAWMKAVHQSRWRHF